MATPILTNAAPRLCLALAAAAALSLDAAPVSAQSSYYWWSDPPPRSAYRQYRRPASAVTSRYRPSREARRKPSPGSEVAATATKEPAREKPKAAAPQSVAAPTPPGQLLTVISISDQKVAVYDSSGVIDRGSVSTGKAGHRTPTGIFSIIQKNRFHRSNIYSGAPMPFMQRITWSGIAMHQGVLPGYPASHGCIRLPQSFAATHFSRTKLGMRVVVSPEPTTAFQIAHDKLPVPVFTEGGGDTSTVAGQRADAVVLQQPVKVASAAEADGIAQPSRLLGPLERAVAARNKAAAEVDITAEAAKVALETAAAASAAAGAALEALRAAEKDVVEAEAELAMVTRALEQASGPEAAEHIKATRAASEERLRETREVMAAARAVEDAKRAEAFSAARAAREAEKAADLAVETAKASRKWTDPISVFVSKKEKRVFVRQGFVPIHDAPVEFKDPETPIGTHLYVAMDSQDGGRSLQWKAVTVPNSGVAPERSGARKKGEEPPPARPRETAAGALERVVLPDEVRGMITDKLWPGASIIISDYGTSNEQSEVAHTDFIVLTR